MYNKYERLERVSSSDIAFKAHVVQICTGIYICEHNIQVEYHSNQIINGCQWIKKNIRLQIRDFKTLSDI